MTLQVPGRQWRYKYQGDNEYQSDDSDSTGNKATAIYKWRYKLKHTETLL